MEICPEQLSRFFFCNSGSEAVDNAIKIARAATGKQNIIAFKVCCSLTNTSWLSWHVHVLLSHH